MVIDSSFINDILLSFDYNSMFKGFDYFNSHRVINCEIEIDEEGISIDSIVKGTHTYAQDIFIDFESEEVFGNCSCPVGYNCKHVAAAILAALEKIPINEPKNLTKQEKSEYERWLNRLEGEKKDYKINNEFFLTYRLFKEEWGSDVEFYKSKILKNGFISKGIKLSNDSILNSFEYKFDYISQEDGKVLSLLYNLTGKYNYDIELKDELGAIALKKMIATNRAFFQDAKEALRFTQIKKELQFVWEEDDKSAKLIPNLQKNEFLVTKTKPLFCIDKTNNLVYELSCNIDLDKIELFLKAPPIPKEALYKVVQKLSNTFGTSAISLPKSLDIQVINASLTPKLTLFKTKDTTHAMRLEFLYSDYVFDLNNFNELIFLDDKIIKIQRDFTKEQETKEYIQNLGFEYSKELNAYISLNTATSYDIIEQWRVFLEKEVESLRQKGWIVEIDESFEYQFEYYEDIFAEFEDKSSNWFNLSFKVTIGGEKLELLPIITPLLNDFDDIKDLPPKLNIKLPNGKFLHIDSNEIKPILKTIYELFDREKNEKIVIKPFDAHLLDFGNNIKWQGAKELQQLAKKLKNFKRIRKIEPSSNLQANLRGYQKKGIAWLNFLHEFKFGGILADDMGLGKTIQTLAYLQILKEKNALKNPSLIIMPTSLIGNWKSEIKKFTPNLSYLELYGSDRKELFKKIKDFDIILTTYTLALRDLQEYKKYQFEYIILDEAQKIKNPKAKITRAIKSLKSNYKLALTGTPIENHLGELWSIFDFLMSGFLGSESEFITLFKNPIEKEKDSKKQKLLNKKIAPFILRRTKEEVVKELPPKTEIIKKTSFKAKQAILYENIRVAMEKKVRNVIKEKGLNKSHIMILDALLKLRQVCCHPQLLDLKATKDVKESAKLELFLDLLDTLMAEDRKVLVFSQFTKMLSILEEEIKKKKIAYTKLTGATKKRQEAIEKFTKGEAKVFLISLKAGGVGLNLVEADTVIHYDPWWNPAVENQATDRAYRIGQNKAVFVYKLLIENSIEEKILELQKKKEAISNGIYSNKEQESINGEELLKLLSL